jgi:NAD(P)-dependent dehydrogenase (short-subunit alcohol dehydrogenase family)
VSWFVGRTAIVTGAAHGIGLAIARQLDELGATVVAVDIDAPGLSEAHGASAIRCEEGDLAGDDTAALAERLIERHGCVDLLVNNVGVDTADDYMALERPAFDLVMSTNLRGPWFFTRRIAADLVERRRGGAFVFISSLHDHVVRGTPHYSASKAAVTMLVREVAQELGPHGIRVNAISPGAVITRGRPPSPKRQRELFPLGRAGEPTDVARVAAVLLSDEWCGYVTGANVPVDGGLALHSWAT